MRRTLGGCHCSVMTPMTTSGRARPRAALLVVVWVLAVPAAAVLGVLALRSAGADSATTVLSAAEAASLAGTAVATPSPADPTPSTTGEPAGVVERRVPGAVLGLRCVGDVPELVWAVPDPGWRVERAEPGDGDLRVRLEADDDDVRVTIACVDGAPEVVGAERAEE